MGPLSGIWEARPPLPTVAAYDDLLHASRTPTEPTPRPTPSGGTHDLQTLGWPPDYTPDCPHCGHPTTGLREKHARVRGLPRLVIITTADPCGCPIDDHAAALQAAAPANQVGTRTTEPTI